MMRILIPILLMIMVSCSSTSSDENKNEEKTQSNWCKYNALGSYEAKTGGGVIVKVSLGEMAEVDEYTPHNNGFMVEYKSKDNESLYLVRSTNDKNSLNFPYDLDSIKRDKTISFSPEGYWIKNSNSEWEDHNFSLDAPFSIIYLNDSQIELKYTDAQNLINNEFDLNLDNSFNSITLSKVVGVDGGCIDFDPKASFNSFSDHEKGFIEHDLEMAENWKLADKELMLDFLLRKPEIEGNAWGAWNKNLVGIGSVFKLDLNGDNEQDICGYFSHEYEKDKKLVFKIFLNNGVTYDEIYSENVSDNWGGDGVFSPSELNDKPVIDCSFLDKAGYVLFYNKLTGKIEKKFYD